MTAGVGCARPSRHALLDVFPIVCLLLLPACSLICLQPLLHHASSNFCPCCGLTDCGFFLFALWVLGGGTTPCGPHVAFMPASCQHAVPLQSCCLPSCPLHVGQMSQGPLPVTPLSDGPLCLPELHADSVLPAARVALLAAWRVLLLSCCFCRVICISVGQFFVAGPPISRRRPSHWAPLRPAGACGSLPLIRRHWQPLPV